MYKEDLALNRGYRSWRTSTDCHWNLDTSDQITDKTHPTEVRPRPAPPLCLEDVSPKVGLY